MQDKKKPRLFLVDDDALYLKSMEIAFLKHSEFNLVTFASGELCLGDIAQNPDAVILDYFLDGVDKNAMNGLETLDRIKAFNPDIPVIMLSAQDKIEVAVNCMRHKAFDYVVKSETAFTRLQNIISAIFLRRKMEQQLTWYMDRM